MAVIIHPSHLIQICVFMSAERTKVSASNVPHAQPGVISSQHFLSLIISSMAVNTGGGQGTKPHSTMLCVEPFRASHFKCSTNSIHT